MSAKLTPIEKLCFFVPRTKDVGMDYLLALPAWARNRVLEEMTPQELRKTILAELAWHENGP